MHSLRHNMKDRLRATGIEGDTREGFGPRCFMAKSFLCRHLDISCFDCAEGASKRFALEEWGRRIAATLQLPPGDGAERRHRGGGLTAGDAGERSKRSRLLAAIEASARK